ncbi:MAG: SLC13 family permease [Xenococcaceae cyanobacterium]
MNGLLIAETDYPGLKLFDLAWVGVPCAIAGIIFLWSTHRWLLPDRQPVISKIEDLREYSVEMVVMDNSPPQYNAVVLAVARNGERLLGKIGDIRLRAGDSLLLEAHPDFVSQQRISKDLYIINNIPDSEPLRYEKASLAVAILIIMVILATVGGMSMLKAAILASIAMVVTGCCSPREILDKVGQSSSAIGLESRVFSSGGTNCPDFQYTNTNKPPKKRGNLSAKGASINLGQCTLIKNLM